jgi:hypothetical protein
MLNAPDVVRDILVSILNLDLTHCEIAVGIASGQADDEVLSYRHIQQASDLEQKFREAIEEELNDYRKGMNQGNLELQSFNVGNTKDDHEIEYLNILPYESILKRIEPLREPLTLPHFEHSEKVFIAHMRFYAMRVQPPRGATPVYFYRIYNAAKMLSQSPFFAMLVQNDLYRNLAEPTFLFDRHIDCISYEEDMFILNTHNFHQMFNCEEFEKTARATLDRLATKDFIHNYSRFKTDCLKDKNKILKLAKIAGSTYLDTLTIDDLQKTIQQYNLPIQVEMVGGKKKMVYDPRGKRWTILQLLNDSYSRSSMTNTDYYVQSKREIKRN